MMRPINQTNRVNKSGSGIFLVQVMAFCQSLLFLLFWLYICACAGGTTTSAKGLDLQLQTSSYEPVKKRNPFRKPGEHEEVPMVETRSVDLRHIHLEGILFQAKDPAAVVNNKLLPLNKIVTLSIGNAEIQVRVVQITRERVVMDVGGKRVELTMTNPDLKPEDLE